MNHNQNMLLVYLLSIASLGIMGMITMWIPIKPFRIIVYILIAIVMGFTYEVSGQTNNYYAKGDFNIELAPQISSGNFFDHNVKRTYGNSTEVKYWQTAWSATGFELGSYDLSLANDQRIGLIDHVAVTEYVRFVPFSSDNPAYVRFFLDRWAIEGKTGAETFFTDGTKDIEIGFQIDYAFNKFCGIESDYWQHIRINQSENGGTFRTGFVIRF